MVKIVSYHYYYGRVRHQEDISTMVKMVDAPPRLTTDSALVVLGLVYDIRRLTPRRSHRLYDTRHP